MLSRKEPQYVLGINEHQTGSGFSSLAASSKVANFTNTSILKLQNSPQQAISIKFTDDCFESLRRACQQNHEVLVHVDKKGITIEIKTSSSTSIKFDCYFQRVSGAAFRVLQRDQNAYNDIANISMRAQVKPTEKTFETSREKAQVVSKHLEQESSKCKTQMLQGPIKPGNTKLSGFTSRIIGKPSIPSPRNGSTLLSIASSSPSRSSPKISPPMRAVKTSRDSPLRERIIHYIICGKCSTQDELVDFILSEGLPSDVKSDSGKRKIREIICEVSEEYRNPAKLVLLQKYHSKVDLNWSFFSPDERSKAEKALAETNLEAGTNFAPLRANTRGPLVAPRAKTKKEESSPTMNNSTTTSPELASEGSSSSTPSPVDHSQLNPNENDSDSTSSTSRRKSKLMDNFKSAGFIEGSPPNKKSRIAIEEQEPSVIEVNKNENVNQLKKAENLKEKNKPKFDEEKAGKLNENYFSGISESFSNSKKSLPGEKEKFEKLNGNYVSPISESFSNIKKSLPDAREKSLAKPVLKTEISSCTSSRGKLVDSGSKSKDKDKEVSKIGSKEEKPSSTTLEKKLNMKTLEKLSKPVNREIQKESSISEALKSMPLRELLGMFSDPVKPSKDYEEKYPAIKSKSDAKIYSEHEMEYYELYEKAYNHLLTVQNDLRTLVERMNNAKTEYERDNLEKKIREYATHCINDASYRNQRRTVANMTKAIQVLRNRMDTFYSENPKQHQ
ncbi:hypothetical protein FO519_005062 [Halicephalobus sp. NKZ332]|nr:hypothetical protein FO519_005062 [Halicephalobus sp. NKZ332]